MMRQIRIGTLSVVLALVALCSCERRPDLHLYDGGNMEIEFPFVLLELDAYWNYELSYGITYDWNAEWYYGWDETDKQLFGEIGYVEPTVFNIRRYFTEQIAFGPHKSVLSNTITGTTFQGKYDWGFWDILVWNDIHTLDGVQSLNFDEGSTLDHVTAFTNETMRSTRYQAPKYSNSFYQPEPLFSAYKQAIEISPSLDGFVYDEKRSMWVKRLDMILLPVTYIYLTQVILHHNNNKIVGCDGNANFSGMARSVDLNTGIAGPDAITISYNVRFKKDCLKNIENVDIVGGRFMTFGLCNYNGNLIKSADEIKDDVKHYMDVTMQFNNGLDSTFVFDITKQVRNRYKGGVITVELDMDTVALPSRSGGSAFDAVVQDYEEGGTWEIPM